MVEHCSAEEERSEVDELKERVEELEKKWLGKGLEERRGFFRRRCCFEIIG